MGKTQEEVRFVNNGDNTVTDSKTGLQWINDHVVLGGKFTGAMTYREAKFECKKLNFAGKKDWRLPSREELLSIVDLARYAPTINPVFVNTASSWYWTKTAVAGFPARVWCVGFGGGVVGYNGKGTHNYVRPVRSSQ